MSIRNQFTNASPGKQASYVLLAVLLLGAISALIFYYVLRTEYRPVFSGLQPADAATIVSELEKRKLPYKLADGGRAILLPEDRADAIKLEIMGTDLPLKGTVGFELFNKSDMGLTDFAQKINYQRALQGELSRTILAMDGVESVRVHLALGEDRLFRQDRVPPKASVMVQMRSGVGIPAAVAQGMQRLVAAAVDKLEPANVVVIDEAGVVVSPAQTPSSIGDTSPAGQEKRAIEDYYEARIRAALKKAYPEEAVAVQVWADIRQAGTSRDDVEEAATWSPDHRNFRLHITLSLERPLALDAKQEIEGLAASAIGLDASLGDAISFSSFPLALQDTPPLSSERAHSRPSQAIPVDVSAPSEPVTVPISYVLLGVLGLALGSLLIVELQRRRKRLDPQQQRAFADRLAQLLQDEEREHVL